MSVNDALIQTASFVCDVLCKAAHERLYPTLSNKSFLSERKFDNEFPTLRSASIIHQQSSGERPRAQFNNK